MIIQTQTIINMLKELAEATNLNIDKELDEIYNFFLIYEKDKQGELNLEQLKKELKAKAIHLKLNGKKVETVKNLRYSKRRKVYILNFLNDSKDNSNSGDENLSSNSNKYLSLLYCMLLLIIISSLI